MAGGSGSVSFVQAYSDSNERMRWKAELMLEENGRSCLVQGHWSDPDEVVGPTQAREPRVACDSRDGSFLRDGL